MKTRLLEALTLARGVADSGAELLVAVYILRSGVLSSDEERQLFEETRKLPRAGMSPRHLANIGMEAVMTHLQWGDRAAAEAERQELANLAAQAPYQTALTMCVAAVEALFAMLDGRLQEAVDLLGSLKFGTFLKSSTFGRAWGGRLANWLGGAAALEAELAWSEDGSDTDVAARGNAELFVDFKPFFLAQLGRLDEARNLLAGVRDQAARSPQEVLPYNYAIVLLEAAALSGDKAAAPALLELAGGEQRRLGKPWFVLVPRHLAGLAALLGDFDRARAGYAEAIDFCERIRYRPELALTRLDLAQLLLNHYPRERVEAQGHLDFAIAEFEAMKMQPSLERALRLRGRRRPAPEQKATAYPDRLTGREVDVLRLIAAGKSNQQIADKLVISFNTVQRHVSNIFAKTGLTNRTEAATYAHHHSLA